MTAKRLVPPNRVRTAPRSDSRIHSNNQMARAVAPITRDAHSDVTVPALALPVPAAGPVPVAGPRPALRIKTHPPAADRTPPTLPAHYLLPTPTPSGPPAADPARP